MDKIPILEFSAAIIFLHHTKLEAFLSFLGLGVQPPFPSWGNMITDGATVMESYPWLIIFPGAVLGITLFSMNFIGDGIRDALDPQNQQG